MKNIFYVLLIAASSSCGGSATDKSKEVGTPKSDLERKYEIAETLLQFDAEKVGLLAIIKKVPEEKAYSVLRDYLAETVTSREFIKNKETKYVVRLVDSIATKNNLSRELTASIIFGYQYELNKSDEYSLETDEGLYYQEDL